jgi:trans-aconitate methyltransferase
MLHQLSEVVRKGSADKTLWDLMEDTPELGRTFSGYMASFAKDLGSDLQAHVPVERHARSLVDLGGSHGLHAIRFCQANPQLHAQIVDLPSALIETETTIKRSNLCHRIKVHHADIVDTNWGSGHDIVLYLSVAHNQSPDTNRNVIRRIAKSLKAGGLLVIHDYLDDATVNAFRAAFCVTLFYETGTKIYSFSDYVTWLKEAGFSSINRIDLDPLEKGSLILARI